ncbi:NAD-dependent epimerase/dehydratase family protein [Sulfurimonas sp. CS5]|uniref:NAD-dependent epimerase/dehydratase family protein n=1 Tax=Sulfurimonas sp. CS5 TaxID=3391145 RepID=UPI0039ED87AA
MQNILISGSTGFIGSYLTEALIQNNYNVILLKRETSNTFRIDKLLDKVTSYDVDKVRIETVFQENDINGIVHLSTYYVKSHLLEDIDDLVESNVTFPTKLLELSIKYNVNFFINTGTFFEYNFHSNPISEKTKKEPFNLYASTKLAFESILQYYALNSNLNILTLKLSAPFGYNDNHKLIPYLMKSVLNNEKVILEKGEQEWDFIYVKDVVSAYIKAIIFCENTYRNVYEDILIGTGKKTSIKEIVNIINNLKGEKLITLEKEYPSNQIFEAFVDNSKAKNLLQWLPQYSIEESLKETYNLYKENEK